jgi:hypothetical protein
LGEPGGLKEGPGDGYLFTWGPRWETWERAHLPAAYVWKKVLGRVSLHIGAPFGDMGRGGPSTGNFEKWRKEALGMVRLSLSLSSEEAQAEGSFTGYPGLCKEGSEDGHLSSWGLSWTTWSGIVYWGL